MAHNVVLTWSLPADAVAGSTYNVYRAPGVCGTGGQVFAKLNSAGIVPLTYTDSTVAIGNSYCYYGTQVQNAVESAASNTAGGTVIPNTFTIQLVSS
jgi:hypothetical protein